MTTIGKWFVLFCFAASMFLLACAIGVYTSHIKWVMTQEEKGKVKAAASAEARREVLAAEGGIIDRLEDRIADLVFARDRAERRYDRESALIPALEGKRRDRQAFYKNKLNLLRTGKDDKDQLVVSPVQQLEPGEGEVLAANLIGPNVISSRGEALRSHEAYKDAFKTVNVEIATEQTRIETAQTAHASLTQQIQGDSANLVLKPGLLRLKDLQDDATARFVAQREYLLPVIANRFAETSLLLTRQKALMTRKQELDQAAPVAVGNR